MDGLNLLGCDDAVGSMPHPGFDNSQSYPTGSVVTYWGQYWQANRDVSPPMFPLVMSGDVPGSSDAWRAMSGAEVANTVLGSNFTDAKTVLAVQKALVKKGYDVGSTGADGVLGPHTVAAIKKFESDYGLDETGEIDEGVLLTLQVAAPTAMVKAEKPSVAATVKSAVQSVVKPSWWLETAWEGGMPRWQVGTVAGGATLCMGALFATLVTVR